MAKKTKFLYIMALALLVSFTACENNTPFDTQSEDDDPIILRPYNESGTGSYNPVCANPDEAYYDSVIAIPTNYTTVNWYLDGQKVYTGYKINMCFPAGHYKLIMEAVTTKGKRTERWGTLTVNPYATDPYAPLPAGGRFGAPGKPVTLSGNNLDMVKEVLLSNNLMFDDATPLFSTSEFILDGEGRLTFTLPELAEGTYQLRFKDADGKLYGSEQIEFTNQSLVSTGYDKFVVGKEWVITGCNLKNVASVKIGETVVTALTVTEKSITLTAPAVEEGEYTLSIANADGSAVRFVTADGLVEQVTTLAKAAEDLEITIWEGSCELNWEVDPPVTLQLTAAMLAPAAGKTIYVYYELPEATYHNLRITSNWWGQDLVAQMDVNDQTPNPYAFEYDERCQNIVASEGDAALIVGFGETITKVTYK